MMKEKILINALSALQGGGQTYLVHLLKDISKFDVDVFLIVNKSNYNLFKEGIDKQIKIIVADFASKSIIHRIIWEAFKLKRTLINLEITLYFSPAGILNLKLPKSCKSLVTFQNMLPLSPNEIKKYPWGYNRIRLNLLKIVYLKSFIKANKIIFLSKYAQDEVCKIYPFISKKSLIIYHGLNKNFLKPATSKPILPFRGEYILYVSTIDVYKSQIELVKTWKMLIDSGFRKKLLLLGAAYTPYKSKLFNEINKLELNDYIYYLGSVPYKQLPTYYQNASNIIFASSCENCPNILLESMGSKKLIFCSYFQPMPEIAQKSVIYFNPYDPTDLFNKIKIYNNNPKVENELASKALKRAKEFSWELTTLQTFNYLKVKSTKKNILIFIEYYLPGVKSGGPAKSISNIINTYGDDFNFYIITRNRDILENTPYPDIISDEWNSINKANVFYLSDENITLSYLKKILNSTNFDLLYLNSFFNFKFTFHPLLLRKLNIYKKKKIILAPRGELYSGAINIKFAKKILYVSFAKLMGLYKNIIWHATVEEEIKEIKNIMGKGCKCKVAPNLTNIGDTTNSSFPIKKEKAPLKLVFLSRLTQKKNLHGALKILAKVKVDIIFDIYGFVEDENYKKECSELIKLLPANVIAQFKDGLTTNQINNILKQYDFFFMPTFGENFGHAIVEALIAGLPVIISDKTPWKNLEVKNIGWDIPLNQPETFIEVIEKCYDLSSKKYHKMSIAANNFIKNFTNNEENKKQYKQLFEIK